MSRIAIIAAMEREIRPAVVGWTETIRQHEGRDFRLFENGPVAVVCGGIGAQAARRACEAMIALLQPELVVSAGFAGALEPGLKVGALLVPRRVVDSSDGASFDAESGEGTLVTYPEIAGVEQKSKLRQSYSAQAVDMEAAAVARSAQARGVRFAAVKAISDESSFALPEMNRFVAHSGQFQTGKFIAFTVVRPWLWPAVIRLANNSSRASNALCVYLKDYNLHSHHGSSPVPAVGSTSRQ